MPRLQKPESTRVHANADASTMSLRWVATCDECAGAPDTRPAHPNTANLFFLQRLWKIPCPVFSIQPAHSRLAIPGFGSVLTLANCLGVSIRTTPQKNRSQRHGTSLHNLLPAKDCFVTSQGLFCYQPRTVTTQESSRKPPGFAVKPVAWPNPQNQLCWQNTQTPPKFRFQVDQQVLICKC